MKKGTSMRTIFFVVLLLFCATTSVAYSMSLDWSGKFHLRQNYIRSHSMGNEATNLDGSAVPNQGAGTVSFLSFSGRLKPKILVNDNLILRVELIFGRLPFNIFGLRQRNRSAADDGSGEKDILTTESELVNLSASRFWADLHTHIGLLQFGKMTFDWGLGAIFNGADDVMDLYQSSNATVRLLSKFGSLNVLGFYSKISIGASLAGSIGDVENNDDIVDYGVGVRYANPKKQLEAGVLLYRRSSSDAQIYFNTPGEIDVRLIDFYVQKKWHRLTAKVELPIYSGIVPGIDGQGGSSEYAATGMAAELSLDFPRWKYLLKLGRVPGQGSGGPSEYGAMYFHRNYKIATILFNYNLYGLGAPFNPFNTAITNANYLVLSAKKAGIKWSWNASFIYAVANETAKSGEPFFSHHTRSFSAANATEDQDSGLGMELDLGVDYQLDEDVQLSAELGLFSPGAYFEFDNNAGTTGKTDLVSALVLSTKVTF